MGDDDRRIYDLVARRFLAVFHPEAVFENTRVETTVAVHIFRTRGKVLLVPGWRGVYGELSDGDGAGDEDEGATSSSRASSRARRSTRARPRRSRRRPSRRGATRDASLLGAMETAGKLVDDEELREAMKESGIGTPATRAAIIERLIDVGYVERDARALVATEKGINVIRLLDEHPLTSPGADRRLGAPPGARSRTARRRARSSWRTSPSSPARPSGELDATLKDVRIPRANLGPCPVCGNDIVENRKGYSCWSREDPGCGFVIWKSKAGKQLPAAVARELIATGRHGEAGHRLQGPQRALVPRQARARADDDEGALARRVRRAVGQGGREAARGGASRRGGRRGRGGSGGR